MRIGIPESYEQSRARFHASLAAVQNLWPEARLEDHALPGDEGLTIDWISVEALEKKQKRLILTTGEHGIEGYVGSVMLQLFMEEYLPRIDPRTTGLLLVHAINPWGMKHRRRVNANNVDLNRTFVPDFSSLTAFNPDYDRLSPLLNPEFPLKQMPMQRLSFLGRTVQSALGLGISGLREAMLKGQYRHPRGIYYGGRDRQPETGLMMDLYRSSFSSYAQCVMLDMHTGYGPRYQMTLVNAVQEKMSSRETADRFGVTRVAAANPQEFYSIQGDMVEYLYTLKATEFPEMSLYATSFEFGTFGDYPGSTLRAMQATIFENQLYWYGGSQSARDWVGREYGEMFAPTSPGWLDKARSDARQAFEGILKVEGFLH